MNFKETQKALDTQIKKLDKMLDHNYQKDLTTALRKLLGKGDSLSLSSGIVAHQFSIQVWEDGTTIKNKSSMKKIETLLKQYSSLVDEVARTIPLYGGDRRYSEIRDEFIKEHDSIGVLKK